MAMRLPKLVTVCTTCNASIVFLEGQEVKKCRYCKSVNQRPQTEREISGIYGQLENADDYLDAGDYDSAEELYDYVIRHQPEEPQAYWGKLMCKYGVQTVGDGPGKTILCHFIRDKSIIAEPDFKKACKYADEKTRAYYEAEGERINAVQMEIRRRCENEKPYDIFLCYKETEPDSGERTKDSERMSELYENLTGKGYRVFYAHRTLYNADVSSEKYEAIIYHAIHTARLMIVFASKVLYLNTFWVKSEWTRYLDRSSQPGDKGSKRIVPLCEGITAEDLPLELRAYQAWQWDSLLSLLNNIMTWIPVKDPEEERKRLDNERQYKLANEYMSKNKYNAAAEIFGLLGDYSNSSLLEKICRDYAQKKDEHEERGKTDPEIESIRSQRKQETEARENERRKKEQELQEERRRIEEEEREREQKRLADLEAQKRAEEYRRIASAGFSEKIKKLPAADRARINKIPISDGVTAIEDGLFQGFTALNVVIIPPSVAEIGQAAFKDCRSLRVLNLPDRLQSIGAYAFQNCMLMKIRIPDSTSFIGEGAFRGCANLKEAALPARIRQMGDGVFYGCRELTDISFPEGVQRLGSDMFNGCAKLREITIPDSVTEIGDRAFLGCQMLSTIVMPSSIRKIGKQVFNNCYSLREIKFLGDRKSWESIEGISSAMIPGNVMISSQSVLGKIFRKR